MAEPEVAPQQVEPQQISTQNLLPVSDWPNVRQVLLHDNWQVIQVGTYQEVAGIAGAIMAQFIQGQLLHKIPIAAVFGVRLAMNGTV